MRRPLLTPTLSFRPSPKSLERFLRLVFFKCIRMVSAHVSRERSANAILAQRCHPRTFIASRPHSRSPRHRRSPASSLETPALFLLLLAASNLPAVVFFGPGGYMQKNVTIDINGQPHRQTVEPRLLLVHFLREVAGLTG